MQQQPPEYLITVPPTQPVPPGAVVGAQAGPTQIRLDEVPNAEAVYHAARNHRRELRGQLEQLEDRRSNLVRELTDAPAAAEAGLRNRLVEIDARIVELDNALAAADAQVAAAAAVPGAVYEEPVTFSRMLGPDPEVFGVVAVVFMLVFLLPLTIAWARRIWRKSPASAPAALPPGVDDRLNRLEAGVDSIALEIERIGEGQRFLTRIMAGERADALTPPSSRS
jgi:hypothetical protein